MSQRKEEQSTALIGQEDVLPIVPLPLDERKASRLP